NTRTQSIIESTINVIFSLFFVLRWGVYGVLLGTISALIYRTSEMIYYTNKHILERSAKYNFGKWILHLILFALIVVMNNLLPANTIQINGIISFIVTAIIVFIIVMFLYVLLDIIFYRNTFTTGVTAIVRRIRKKK